MSALAVTDAEVEVALFSEADKDTAMLIDLMGMGTPERLPDARRIIRKALEAAAELRRGEWLPIESAPMDGQCLLWVATDDGGEVMKLYRDADGNWIHEGEPTFCATYYLEPTHWQPLPAAPAAAGGEGESNG